MQKRLERLSVVKRDAEVQNSKNSLVVNMSLKSELDL